jgi:hypothetical protein
MTLPFEAHLRDHAPDEPSITILLQTDDEPISIQTVDGGVRVRLGASEQPDAVLTGPPKLVFVTVMGRLDLTDAQAKGLRFEGDPAVLERVRPGVPASV